MKIKGLPKVERPRERLMRYGVGKLTNEELLAIILGTGKKGENVLQLARRFFRKYKKTDLFRLDLNELKNNFGLGLVKTCQVIAAIELGKRLINDEKPHFVLSPKDIFNQLIEVKRSKKEYFIVYYLDVSNQVIKKETISIGILNASLVHPREVFEPAVKYLAAQIILVHNHPSGVVEPSDEDVKLTKRLVEAGKIMGIEVMDHVIVTEEKYYSFKENNII